VGSKRRQLQRESEKKMQGWGGKRDGCEVGGGGGSEKGGNKSYIASNGGEKAIALERSEVRTTVHFCCSKA